MRTVRIVEASDGHEWGRFSLTDDGDLRFSSDTIRAMVLTRKAANRLSDEAVFDHFAAGQGNAYWRSEPVKP